MESFGAYLTSGKIKFLNGNTIKKHKRQQDYERGNYYDTFEHTKQSLMQYASTTNCFVLPLATPRNDELTRPVIARK